MSRIEINDAEARPVHMRPLTDEELEAEAIRWCERMGRKLSAKKSNSKPRRYGSADHR